MLNKEKKYNLLLLVAFLIGFTGLCYEIIATKILFYFFSENSLSVSTVISIFLLGLGLGSFIFGKIVHNIKNKENFILVIQVLIALYALFVFPNFDIIPTVFNALYNDLNSSIQLTLLNKFLISFLYLIIPTLLIGTSLPSVMVLILNLEDDLPAKISTIYGVDLIGAVLGSFLSGYIFIPFFGLKTLIFFTIMLNLLTGLILIVYEKKKALIYGAFSLLFIIFAIFFINPVQYSMPTYVGNIKEMKLLYQNANKFKKSDVTSKLFSKNSPYGQVTVIDENMMNEKVRSLYINNRLECTTVGIKRNHIAKSNSSEVHFANDAIKEINRKNLKVLNIGLGCGLTLASLAQNPNVKSVDVVEINPKVVEASKFFNDYSNDVLNDPKTKLIVNDGYYHLFKGKNKYDLIIVDIENPAIIESSKLYTQEFYKIVQKSLSDDGVFALWAYAPVYNVQEINYNTLSSVFPFLTAKISGPFGDIYFFAKNSEIKNISLKKSDEKYLRRLQNSTSKKINTLNNPALSLEWMRTGTLNVDKY